MRAYIQGREDGEAAKLDEVADLIKNRTGRLDQRIGEIMAMIERVGNVKSD